MKRDVAETWNEIDQWLATHTPATRHALGAVETSAVEKVTGYLGVAIDDNLAEYLANVPGSGYANILGLHYTLPVDAMLADSTMRARGWREAFPNESPGQVAGTPEHLWSNRFLAITSDGGGNALFVDLRDGTDHGCVRQWDKVDGSYRATPLGWTGLHAMLTDLLDSLTTGRPFMRYFAPSPQDGLLDWEWVEP